ncbi:hypothetical protein [Flagellimonas sp.]|uniref:hypothetical protein n=1 Tax=Flagellimonas sp. TaxID=2058762 RepID=UPI003BAE18EA
MMYNYKIVDNSLNGASIQEGRTTLEGVKEFVPLEIYEMLLKEGTISVKEQSGHMTYEISKV